MPPVGDPAIAVETSTEHCLDCGAETVGEYCQACGQRCGGRRLRVALLGQWMINDVFAFDRGLLLTIREMTLRPGQMIRCYVAGRRRRYTNPFTYLFLWGGLSLLVWALVGDAFLPQMKATIAEATRALAGYSPAQKARLTDLQIAMIPYTAQVGLVLCLPFAVVLRLSFRKVGYNFAEIFVFAVFSTGQHFLVYSVLTTALFPVSRSFHLNVILLMLLYLVIYTQAAFGFFKRSFGTFVKVFFAFAISFILYSFAQTYLLRAYVRLTS
jgi:uncharacterized protein DUF3667